MAKTKKNEILTEKVRPQERREYEKLSKEVKLEKIFSEKYIIVGKHKYSNLSDSFIDWVDDMSEKLQPNKIGFEVGGSINFDAIKINQGSTKPHKRGILEGAKPDSKGKMPIPEAGSIKIDGVAYPEANLIPIFVHESRSYFENEDASYPTCSSPDGQMSYTGITCMKCKLQEWGKKTAKSSGKPPCTKSKAVVFYFEKTDKVYYFYFASSSYKVGNALVKELSQEKFIFSRYVTLSGRYEDFGPQRQAHVAEYELGDYIKDRELMLKAYFLTMYINDWRNEKLRKRDVRAAEAKGTPEVITNKNAGAIEDKTSEMETFEGEQKQTGVVIDTTTVEVEENTGVEEEEFDVSFGKKEVETSEEDVPPPTLPKGDSESAPI